MSFTPLSRVKNYTLDSLKLFLDIFKLIPDDIDSGNGQNFCEEQLKGFIKSYYQVAAQIGIYNHYAQNFSYHKYLLDFSDYDLRKYLSFWFKIYYAPNKYVQSDDSPIIIYVELVKELLKNKREVNLDDFFSQKIGGKSYDIFINALKRYCPELTYSIKNDVQTISISQDDIDEIKKEIDFIEKYFPIPEDYNNPNVFFERFNYDNFCKFYKKNTSKNNSSKYIKINNSLASSSPSPYTHPQQIIFYGVPGCGKSHKISEMLKDKNQFKIDSEEEQIGRTVFHPDYTNSDFVGQIMPAVDNGRIEYKFTPGPFTKILAKALKHSENQYVLIIEEINRGNAAAIFGEIFQLLDRIKSGKTTKEKLNDGTLNTYGEGWSEYFFMDDEINHYILKECNGDESNKSVNISGICFSENTGIRLPPNLSILATMNTSDQNVFTLDNAFQRRWDMKYIPNKIDYIKAPREQQNQYDSMIGKTKISWGVFRDVVNDFIANPENSFSNAEDKQLGLFFISADVDISEESGNIKEDEFANKVLKYLWNDIFKRRLSESSIFNENIKTFGELVSAFYGEKAFDNCFCKDFVDELNKRMSDSKN